MLSWPASQRFSQFTRLRHRVLHGGVAGAAAGHVVHHGVIGAVGDCIAGHELHKHQLKQQRLQQQNYPVQQQ